MKQDYELKLTDFIDVETLQRIQNAFSRMTGIAVITIDAKGAAVTKGTDFSDFCMKYTRSSAIGCERCLKCDKEAAERALIKKAPVIYHCHAGLLNFAAPIMTNDKLLGCFIGGQALKEPMDPDAARKIAEEIQVDPEEYLEAAKRIRVVDQNTIENAAEFLYIVADVLSDMAYNKNLVQYTNLELEKSANMKSDFLANMSHEIRTPMNAVIGMAEMALREELPPAAKEHINQIKESGKALLTIINDILDFSKIESGKMDIIPVEYEPMSMIYDVANIVMTRLKGKEVELILAVSPDLPHKLIGDPIRIKQVLLNIANNAAKFTSKGQILIQVENKRISSDEIELGIAVEDTGIGIKKEDMGKLFRSFQQVDSKRNRNIEGTGLGLAISRQLLTLMNGSIQTESEYNKGSKFSFFLPQKIADQTPSIVVKESDSVLAAGLISNPYIREGLYSDLIRLGVEYQVLSSERDLGEFPSGKKVFLFIEHPMFSDMVKEYIKKRPQITAVLLINFDDNVKYDISNVLVIKKPLFALNIAVILNREELHFAEEEEDEKGFDFTAPGAEILIVDDNAVNLTVAEGLLEPLKMKIDTALSGKAAIEKISKFHYDIIFMDHMMPELDGVETTHIIRRFYKDYDKVPIIALTANAVEGTKEMFCREGMDDFVAKPIELRMLISKVKKWLPPEKIQKVHSTLGVQKKPDKSDAIVVGDLNVAMALKFLGNEALFWSILKVYYRSIEKKAKMIKELEEAENWKDYTIEVHALKSSSRQIGATSLSDKAAALEKSGNALDGVFIHRRTDEMLEQYLNYLPILEPFCSDQKKETAKKKISKDQLLDCFGKMRNAIEELDMDAMSDVISDMEPYGYEGWQQESFAELKDAVEDVDVDRCEEILKNWEEQL